MTPTDQKLQASPESPPTFGDLRSLVQQEPTDQVWAKVCAMVQRWPDEGDKRQRVLPYLQGVVRQWPASIRVAQRGWFDRLLLGFDSPEMALVGHVKFEGRKLSIQEMQHLCRAPNLGQVEILSFYGSGLEPPMIQALLEAKMPQIHTLQFVQNPLSDQGLKVLAAYPRLAELCALQLSFAQVGPQGLESLCSAGAMPRLRELVLSHNFLGSEGMRVLCQHARLPVLERVDLGYNRLRAQDASALVEDSTLLRHLTTLTLTGNALGDHGVAALVESPMVHQLKILHLGYNRVRTAGIEAIAQSEHLGGLEELHLVGNVVDDRAATALARSRGLGGLRRLTLEEGGLSDRGRRVLVTSPYLHAEVKASLL